MVVAAAVEVAKNQERETLVQDHLNHQEEEEWEETNFILLFISSLF